MLYTQQLKSSVQRQKGFTLLELLMVIAVIGILATIAVPRFQNYGQRARFTEVVNAANPFKAAIDTCAQQNNSLANCGNGANGIPANVGASTSGVVASVVVGANGVITATGGVAVDGATYILVPTIPNAPTSGANASSDGVSWTISANSTCLASGLCSQ